MRLERTAKRIAITGKTSGRDSQKALTIVTQYPSLGRLWARQIEGWVGLTRDFLGHIEEFASVEKFSASASLVRNVVAGLSDPRNGNRSVMRVDFANRQSWFYKPRDVAPERAWFTLLKLLNEHGFRPGFKVVKLFGDDCHCWMEAISVRRCNDAQEVIGFYFTAGALLYLVHLMRGVDFHAGNVIAHGRHPVLVDCETLFHPKTWVPAPARLHERSILRTGLLPVGQVDEHGDLTSGLARSGEGAHAVYFRRRRIYAKEHVGKLTAGFEAIHSFLGNRMGKRLITELRAVLPKRSRQIHRPTSLYDVMLDASVAPELMRDGLERSRFLHAACDDGSVSPRHIAREVLALEDADIPTFYGKTAQPAERLSESDARGSLRLIREAFL
jgi:lantibiotic modifying enzyme